MVTNMMYVGEGPIRLRFKNGQRFNAVVLENDRVNKLFNLEVGEGLFATYGWEELDFVSIPIKD